QLSKIDMWRVSPKEAAPKWGCSGGYHDAQQHVERRNSARSVRAETRPLELRLDRIYDTSKYRANYISDAGIHQGADNGEEPDVCCDGAVKDVAAAGNNLK
ncbi:MAG TPA: hypothetical protein VED01_18130, partial [Burkholderiales bacterium]|nr:hypothetical protein [Burkholderiales bacterium]